LNWRLLKRDSNNRPTFGPTVFQRRRGFVTAIPLGNVISL
jgi:hypothetical protein